MANTRTLDFLDGTHFIVEKDTCRGCFINNVKHPLSELLEPVLEDKAITVRQDAEWPVPGFYIIGLRDHIGTFADIDLKMLQRISIVLHVVRKAMREALGIANVHMFQEEKFVNAHLHIWLLPLWPQVMADHAINPRIYESNIMEYIQLFSFAQEEESIRQCNMALKRYLCSMPLLQDEGFIVP